MSSPAWWRNSGCRDPSVEVAWGGKTIARDSGEVPGDEPLAGHAMMAEAGMCAVTRDFVIDFVGAGPAIRGSKIGQALARSQRRATSGRVACEQDRKSMGGNLGRHRFGLMAT